LIYNASLPQQEEKKPLQVMQEIKVLQKPSTRSMR